MNKFVVEWCEFCEEKKDFDTSYFHTLFFQDPKSTLLTPFDLKEIIKYFPNSEALYGLLNKYLFENENDYFNTIDSLLLFAIKDIEQKVKLIKSDYFKTNLKFEFTEDFKFVSKLKSNNLNLLFFDEFEDIYSEHWVLKDKKTFALYEALYGLTKNYEIVWYLFSPLVDLEMNFEYYEFFLKSGGVYAFEENKVLISTISTRK